MNISTLRCAVGGRAGPSLSIEERASKDGAHVILGTGDVFSGSTLAYQGSLPRTIRAALWRTDGDLVTLAEDAGATLLERWSELWHRKSVERLQGTPLYLLQHESQLWALVNVAGKPRFIPSSHGSDGDCDGIDYEHDRFPTDPAAAQDSDYDGFPDAWNPGRLASDSTTGLTLDEFPNDSACHLAGQGIGGNPSGACDILKALDWSSFVPAFGALDKRGVVYLFRTNSPQVARWDSATGTALNPLILSGHPASATYSNERDRLYVALQSGEVVQFDSATSLRPLPFAFTYQPVRDIVDAEGFVLVASQDTNQSSGTFLSYAPSGAVVDDHAHNSLPYGAAYSPARDRLYFADQWADGHYVDVDPVKGLFGTTANPFFSDTTIQLSPPIQFASNGAEVFFGSGRICNADLTTVLRSFPTASKFLVTTPNRLMTIASSYPDTLVRRYFGGTEGGTDLVPGQPQLLLDAGANALVVTIVPAVSNTLGRDPPSFHFVDYWKDP